MSHMLDYVARKRNKSRCKSSARHNICPKRKRNSQKRNGLRGYFSRFQTNFNTHACKSSARQAQTSKKLVGKDQMLINNLQVKCKTSPEQQKTSWKRPDVYKQLASQMRDLSSINDSIYMQVKCKTK